MNRLIFTFQLLANLACASVVDLDGTLADGTPFHVTAEYQDDLGDQNLENIHIGEFYSESSMVLTFLDQRVEAQGLEIYVYSDFNGTNGFYFYNEWPFLYGDILIPEDGLYFAVASPFVGHLFPNDSLSLILSTAEDPLMHSLAVFPYLEFRNEDLSFHLESNAFVEYTVQAPEPDTFILLGMIIAACLGFYRDRKYR
jgi:hypothetical protein